MFEEGRKGERRGEKLVTFSNISKGTYNRGKNTAKRFYIPGSICAIHSLLKLEP